jgi:hypothetical protein
VSSLVNNTSTVILKAYLEDPRLKYTSMRAVYNAAVAGDSIILPKNDLSTVDIDELIKKNEDFIRQRGSARNTDNKYLLSFEDMTYSFKSSQLVDGPDGSARVIRRYLTPEGGYQALDYHRCHEEIFIQPSPEACRATVDKVSCKVFDGLKWENILVTGAMIVDTLLSMNSEKYSALNLDEHAKESHKVG